MVCDSGLLACNIFGGSRLPLSPLLGKEGMGE